MHRCSLSRPALIADRGLMNSETILFISSQKIGNNSVLAAVKATGRRVVSATSTEAVALLFIMHCAAVVLLDRAACDDTCFHLAQTLRAIRPDVPIVLLSPNAINPLPSCLDACISTAPPLTNVTSAVLRILAVVGTRSQRDSLQQVA
jgi:CheY-like chemotaxis protein